MYFNGSIIWWCTPSTLAYTQSGAGHSELTMCTPPKHSTICVMVGSSSKNSTVSQNILMSLEKWFLCNNNNSNSTSAFIHALWVADPSKRATGRICSQALKTRAAQRWPQCCVWQTTSPGWSPTLYEKACNFNVSRCCSTGTQDHHFMWLSEPRYAIHPLWCLHV